jgi:EAL domain-containing protein (putative c-di-GMP-specific phosphodiesterase class I)/CheY-like chemotaxis protein
VARVLVVDDDTAVLNSVIRVLQGAGHEVHGETHGAASLDIAGRQPFDAAIVDYKLNQMSGLDVLQKLRDIQPRCVRMLMTGELVLPLVVTAVNVGKVSRVIEKPFSANLLIETLQDAVDGQNRLTQMLRNSATPTSAKERRVLQECLNSDALKLALQPIIDTASGKVYGYEMLLRSSNPALPGPAEVLSAAERHGLLRELGNVVVARAAEWLMRLPSDIHLFLNVHPGELSDPASLCTRLEVLQMWAPRVILEITERAKMSSSFSWERALERVKQMGFGIAVDDLGSGYSALSMLAELQPDFLKIDMSIIRDVDTDTHKRRLVDLLCSFAEATDSRVVAEGVETRAEADALEDAGVQMLQGFLFGMPDTQMPA